MGASSSLSRLRLAGALEPQSVREPKHPLSNQFDRSERLLALDWHLARVRVLLNSHFEGFLLMQSRDLFFFQSHPVSLPREGSVFSGLGLVLLVYNPGLAIRHRLRHPQAQ